VVQIRTVGFGAAQGQEIGFVASQRGAASGVIIDSDGFIVTNAHVVKGARHIDVWFNESNLKPGGEVGDRLRQRSVPARIVGTDLEMDLALLKVDVSGLNPLRFTDSDKLRQGQIVMAIGSPMTLENSVTMGVVSSTERQLRPEDPNVYIQTDTPINPGNSGGPLVDVEGGLVGINTLILSQSGGSEGIGFAIPANTVKRISSELRKNGHVHHGVIGVLSLTVTPGLAAGLQLPQDWGVMLEDVEPDGPADKAGLQPGDFVDSVDGRPVKDNHQFLLAIDRHAIDDSMQIGVLRGGKRISTSVKISERDDDPNRFLELVTEKANLIGRLGILAVDINEQILKMLSGLRMPAGVVVAAGVLGLPGAEDGLVVGDLIISLNGKPVANIEALRTELEKMPTGTPAVFQVQRDNQLRLILLDLP
jgi:serine protease Do